MLGIRKAGEALANFDRAYADRAYNDLDGDNHAIRGALGGIGIADLGIDPAVKGVKDRILTEIMRAGFAGTNLGYRYGLPAAGVTLAGKGLYDLTSDMGNTTEGELPM